MEQFLVWLVQGAVRWYANGEQLLPMPARSIAALDAYQVDNNPFAAFLEWSCDLGPNLFMPTVAGMQAYNSRARLVDGQPAAYTFDLVGTQKFKELMAGWAQFRGPAKTNVLGLGTIAGVTERGYRGLALKQPLPVAPGSYPA
jgi:phage/plasmid-associated DNA primase